MELSCIVETLDNEVKEFNQILWIQVYELGKIIEDVIAYIEHVPVRYNNFTKEYAVESYSSYM